MPTDTSITHVRRRDSRSQLAKDTALQTTSLGRLDSNATLVAESLLQREDTGRNPARPGEQARQYDEGLLRYLWIRFFGRQPHRLLEEGERVPFLARILTVAQSLA